MWLQRATHPSKAAGEASTHTHTHQFCAVAVVTQQLAGLGQQQIVDPPPSHVTPNMSSHTHTHTHRRTQHHLSLLQLIKLIKLVM